MSRIIIEYASCKIELDPVEDETFIEQDGNGKTVVSFVNVKYRTDDLVNAFVMAVRALDEKTTDAGELVKLADQLAKESGRKI